MTQAGPRDGTPNDTPSILSRLQRGLEHLYRVETYLHIDAFVVGAGMREQALAQTASGGEGARRPREQLLVRDDGDGVGIGLFFDHDVIENLERHDPAHALDDRNFFDFCLAVEGVSHFVYVAVRAAGDRPVRPVEIELQAEVDKFATCVLLSVAGRGYNQDVRQRTIRDVRERLFHDCRFADDLSHDERDRYRAANDLADRYAGALEQRFVRRDRTADMLFDLRRFYRLDLGGKIDHIRAAA